MSGAHLLAISPSPTLGLHDMTNMFRDVLSTESDRADLHHPGLRAAPDPLHRARLLPAHQVKLLHRGHPPSHRVETYRRTYHISESGNGAHTSPFGAGRHLYRGFP